MKRNKHDCGKPIPKSDLDKIEVFKAELRAMAKLRAEGKTQREAREIVWAEYFSPKEN